MEPIPIRRLTTLTVAVALAALLLAPAPAVAHIALVSSTPADGAELTTPPQEVVLTFDGELDPAASGFTVTGADGSQAGRGEVDLAVAERNVLRGDVSIGAPGPVTVAWTVAGTDGHTIEGTLTFTIADDDADEGRETPDTAVGAPGSSGGVGPAGALLLLGAAAIGVVRLARRMAVAR